MNNTLLMRLFSDMRISMATVLAVWISLFVPMVLMVAGILVIGGGMREALAVIFAAALFSAADIFGLLVRLGADAEDEEPAIAALFDLPVIPMARAFVARYL